MMLSITALNNFTPSEWSTENYEYDGHTLVTIENYSSEYHKYSLKMVGAFNGGIKRIERVQNPFLYGQFLLKQEEYKSRNIAFSVTELFHDTAEGNIKSIVTNNFDWRLTKRAKFGLGVSFSPSTAYANKQSSFKNGTDRAMIVADVLVGNKEVGGEKQILPRSGDTTTGNKLKVYVKYFDYEFYPKYVVYYKNISQGRNAQKYRTAYGASSSHVYDFDVDDINLDSDDFYDYYD